MKETVDRLDDTDIDAALAWVAAHALAQRIVLHAGTSRDHWSTAAQPLITGMILYLMHDPQRWKTRVTLRCVCDKLAAAQLAPTNALWVEMSALATEVPAAAATGRSMLQCSEEERASIIMTASTTLEKYLDAGFESACAREMQALLIDAHRYAALAVHRAVTAFLRSRLSCKYSLQSEIAVRLKWLIDATDFVFAAIACSPSWDREATRKQLARLDAEVGDGSLWRCVWNQSAGEEQDLAMSGGDNAELPKLLETYDDAFVARVGAVREPEFRADGLN